MDVERIKKDFKWDPSHGDYSKNHVSYERGLLKKKQTKKVWLILLYLIVLIAVIVMIYFKVK